MGIWTNLPSKMATTIFCDATVDIDFLSLLLPNAKDITPEGNVKLVKSVIQFPQDITRKTKQGPFHEILRGLLAMFPQHQRDGLITHSTLTGAVKTLGPPFVSRIVEVTHFGSGKRLAARPSVLSTISQPLTPAEHDEMRRLRSLVEKDLAMNSEKMRLNEPTSRDHNEKQ